MTMHNAAHAATCNPSAVVEREQLAFAFDTVKLACEKRTATPILATTRIKGDGLAATVTATDLDMEISVTVPGAVDSRLDMCLDTHKFADLLKKAPASDMVALSQPGAGKPAKNGDPTFEGQAVADFETVNFRLPVQHPSDWPEMPRPGDHACAFEMDGPTVRDAFDNVAGAISKEETRYYLNGVYMHRLDMPGAAVAPLVFVATYDGDEIAIGWKASYMLDMLATAGEAVTIAMGDAGAPCIVTGDDEAWTGVLMPMRV